MGIEQVQNEPDFALLNVSRGLGLAVVVGVMQSHRGAVTVESSLGKGTTVRILFPPIASLESDALQNEAGPLSGNILLGDEEITH